MENVIETEDNVKVPVQNAEESLIGIFMQDDDSATFIAQSGLRDEHFLNRKCRMLYPVVLNIRLTQGVCNFDFVVDACEKKLLQSEQTLLEYIGGVPYLTKVIASPIATDLKTTEGYVDIIYKNWQKSKLNDSARKLIGMVGMDEIKTVDILSEMQGIISNASLKRLGLTSIDMLLPESFLRYEDRLAHPEKYVGLKTGFYWLDKYRAVSKKHTTIVGAKTNVGKSCLVSQIAVNIATNGAYVLIFTPEMSKEECVDRIVCSSTGTYLDEWKEAKIRQSDVRKIHAFQTSILGEHSNCIYIDDRGSQTVNYIISSIKRHMLSHPVDVVVIDYMQKMKFYNDNIRREVDDALDKLSSFAKDNDIAMIIVSQLRRTVNEPALNDLKESGNLENYADVVILLHRVPSINIEEGRKAWYQIAKNRIGRNTGYVKLEYNYNTLKFVEAEPPPTSEIDDPTKADKINEQETNEQSVMEMIDEYDKQQA